MASQKISEFSAITTLASGDFFPVVQASGTTNKRVDVGVLDNRYAAVSSGALAHEALASGNAALTLGTEALASGNAALSVAVPEVGALASGNAALTDVASKYAIAGGPITGVVTTQSQSIGEVTTTALTSGVITFDFGAGNNFDITLGGNSTLAGPTTPSGGQTGTITIRQDGTGSRTLAYSGGWQFSGGTAPTLTTTASGVDVLSYYCSTPSEIQAVLTTDLQ
tara:strand:- start:556 stop:1227 length:672 start_codon:yes stop_codon:yes gene_type:complete